MASPMMTQYWEIKNAHPNDVVFFRLGDFYEMFGDDAKEVSALLELVLTRRKNKVDGEIPMCGIPYHSAESYLARLVQSGKSVAICEQMEPADKSVKLVDRRVVRVITPGTVQLEGAMDQSRANYIAAVSPVKSNYALALADVSTGEMKAGLVSQSRLRDILEGYAVREVVYPENWEPTWKSSMQKLKFSPESKWSFDLDRGWESLCQHFAVASLEGFGFERESPALGAAAAALAYLKYTQQTDLEHIHIIKPFTMENCLEIDSSTLRNLEVFYPSHPSPRAKSLYEVMNFTVNPMGARRLRHGLLEPFGDKDSIESRQSEVTRLLEDDSLRASIREALSHIVDIERILGRVASGLAGPRDLGHLRESLVILPSLIPAIAEDIREHFTRDIAEIQPLLDELSSTLKDDLPVIARDGGFVRKGYRDDIDRLLSLSRGGKEWIIEHQEQQRGLTNIPSLKVSYNKVFGYYIEVTKAHSAKVPESYIKKQTLVNADRYITEELKEFEEHILVAEQELLVKEQQIFEQLIGRVLAYVSPLQRISAVIAEVDLVQSLATLAQERNYICPEIVHESLINIQYGRHPVVEAILDGSFTPNDTTLGVEDTQTILLTGPNMGGKSTYIRQIAIITLLAHIGSYVPAKQATIGLVDRIFTRVGASDNLSEGQSTFMVEMIEVANILRNATKKSLVILDEVGRGTSTYDGMSIAQSITEYLAREVGCRTLFATHYHELLRLERELPGVKNYRILVDRDDTGIRFLHKVEPGGADESYGIDIAALAGFPEDILLRARTILSGLELSPLSKHQPSLFQAPSPAPQPTKPSVKEQSYDQLKTRLQEIDINQMTPLEALGVLAELIEEGK